MAKTWEEIRAANPPDEVEVAKHKDRMLRELRGHRLAELRHRQDVTQAQLAETLGVSQPRISQIESGDVDDSELATLRSYVEALGGRLEVVAVFSDERYVVG
jgi:DNA-binding XRE family transcriptional regulator